MHPFPIAGLKQSGPLALVRAPGATGPWLRSLLNALAAERLNLALVAWQLCPGAEPGLCFCVEEARGSRALALAREIALAHDLPRPSLIAPAFSLTLYPLGRSLKLPALMLTACQEAALQPLGMASSLSALAALFAGDDLKAAMAAMQNAFTLPPEATPPQMGVKVVQAGQIPAGSTVAERISGETVAVYAECPVSCYGLKEDAGLALWQAHGPGPALASALSRLAALEPPPRLSFMAGYWHEGSCSLSVCLPKDQEAPLAQIWAGLGSCPPGEDASLVHLQGPHFGDRPGIAHEALAGLAQAGVEPLALSGVVHSLFLALRPGDAKAALEGLAAKFCGPRR